MRTIHRRRIPVSDEPTTISVQDGACLVYVGRGPNTPPSALDLWFEVDTDADSLDLTFSVHSTGHPVPDGAVHQWSVVDGPFVWHVYERL